MQKTLRTILPHPLASTVVLPSQRHPVAVYLDSATSTAESRHVAVEALHIVARILTESICTAHTIDWGKIGYAEAQVLRRALIGRYAAITANRILGTFRQCMRAAYRLGHLTADQLVAATDIKTIPGESLPRGRALTMEEIVACLEVCERGGLRGLRDGALLSLLVGTGVRRAEVAALAVADYDPLTGRTAVRRGKGNKGHITYVGSAALRDRIRAWLDVRGRRSGPLITQLSRHHGVQLKSVSKSQVNNLVHQIADSAGIPSVSTHDLRRTNITQLRRAGADLELIAGLVGHASVKTTERYLRRTEDEHRLAASLLRLPDE